jgi:hypothetical protein
MTRPRAQRCPLLSELDLPGDNVCADRLAALPVKRRNGERDRARVADTGVEP